jgi:quinol-cytochrome oxidoreductase complex cytochrome b subunit
MRPNFFYHLHPPTIPAKQARWRYTLGAGGMAVFLVLILVITGALEMFFYIPTPAEAANSIQTLTYIIPFGGLLRNLHFWSAQLLVIISGVHLIRVVFTGSATRSRRFNYVLGLISFCAGLIN